MSVPRILVGGIGNIFLGDDGFGSEAARRLAGKPLPPEVRLVDFGIRGLDLMYALLESYERVILIDTIQRGGAPGTLYTVEPILEGGAEFQAHDLPPAKALAAAKAMGASLANVVIIGCEPESFGTDDNPQMGLNPKVEAAVDQAMALVLSMVSEDQAATHA